MPLELLGGKGGGVKTARLFFGLIGGSMFFHKHTHCPPSSKRRAKALVQSIIFQPLPIKRLIGFSPHINFVSIALLAVSKFIVLVKCYFQAYL